MWKLLALPLIVFISACGQKTIMTKSNFTNEQWSQDLATCKYQAAVSTANYNTGATRGGYAGAISQGIGEGIAIAMNRNELIKLCLESKGYTEQSQ